MRIALVSDNGTVIESWTIGTPDDDDTWALDEELWGDIRLAAGRVGEKAVEVHAPCERCGHCHDCGRVLGPMGTGTFECKFVVGHVHYAITNSQGA